MHILPTELKEPHVTNVEQTGGLADNQVFVLHRAVANGHLPTGKWDHLGPCLPVDLVEHCLPGGRLGRLVPGEGRHRCQATGRLGPRPLPDPVGLVESPARPTSIRIFFAKGCQFRWSGLPFFGQHMR